MRRRALVMLFLVGLGGCSLGGCTSVSGGPDSGGPCPSCGMQGRGYSPPAVPGVQGPWGQAVPMAAPYCYAPPGAQAAQAMLGNSIPLDMVQMNGMGAMARGLGGPGGPGMNPSSLLPQTIMPAGGILSPPGMPGAPGMPSGGVIQASMPPGSPTSGGIMPASYPPGAVAAVGALTSQVRFPTQRTQVRFGKPSGMKISWYTVGSDGKPSYSTTPIEAPGRYNFLQGAIYRLKLSNLEGRPGLVDIYPTLEVVPANPKTEAFLSHSSVPVDFTAEDFKQIAEGNYVVKVIYLPDPQYQELAGTGTEEILSTRLEPGADPIAEALRRGSILLVIRMGNMDQEAPFTPPLGAPGPGGQPMGMPGMGMPGMGMPGMGMPGMGMGPGGPMPPFGGPLRAPAVQIGPLPTPPPGGPFGPIGPGGPMMPPGAMPPGGMPPSGMPSAGMPLVGPKGPMMPPPGLPSGPFQPKGFPSNSAGPGPGKAAASSPENFRKVPPPLPNAGDSGPAAPSLPSLPPNNPSPVLPLPGTAPSGGPNLGPAPNGASSQLPDESGVSGGARPATALGER